MINLFFLRPEERIYPGWARANLQAVEPAGGEVHWKLEVRQGQSRETVTYVTRRAAGKNTRAAHLLAGFGVELKTEAEAAAFDPATLVGKTARVRVEYEYAGECPPLRIVEFEPPRGTTPYVPREQPEPMPCPYRDAQGRPLTWEEVNGRPGPAAAVSE